jgi:ribonuclease HI
MFLIGNSRENREPAMDKISVYTDGSCNSVLRIGAWAAIIFVGTEKKTLQEYAFDTTHQRMELTAVIAGLEYILLNGLADRPIMLYTDSQYVSGLNQRKEKLINTDFITQKNNTLRNSDLISKLFTISAKLRITIIKIKAHQKNSYHEQLNGEVDRLCRKTVRALVDRTT